MVACHLGSWLDLIAAKLACGLIRTAVLLPTRAYKFGKFAGRVAEKPNVSRTTLDLECFSSVK